jgi:branched-chain amino acid transport system permease protein
MSIELFGLLLIVAAVALRIAPVVPTRLRVPGSLAVVLLFLAVAPWVLEDFRLFQLSRVAVFAIVAMGLNMLTGYNGQISLGHGAFMLLGAYATAILMDDEQQLGFVDSSPWPFWACIIVSGVVGGALGFLLGFPALRLSGPYLAIATLALIISAPSILRKYDNITGGSEGLFIDQPPPPPGLEEPPRAEGEWYQLNNDEWIYLLFLLIAVVMMVIAWSIVRGPLGRAFVAVRDSETAAAAMGINVARVKVTAFTISAFYAGVAGALFALQNEVVTPESIRVEESINFLTAIVIGGLASILGSVLGALLLVALTTAPEFVAKLPFLSEDFVKQSGGAIQGVLVILVVLLMPYGAAGAFHRLMGSTPAGIWHGLAGVPGRIRGWGAETAENWRWTFRELRRTHARLPLAFLGVASIGWIPVAGGVGGGFLAGRLARDFTVALWAIVLFVLLASAVIYIGMFIVMDTRDAAEASDTVFLALLGQSILLVVSAYFGANSAAPPTMATAEAEPA